MTDAEAGPVCVFCRKGTTPQRLVLSWFNFEQRCLFYAHAVCANRRNRRAPIPKSRHNKCLEAEAPSPVESLARWNALVDELDRLLAHMRAVPHALGAMKAACDVMEHPLSDDRHDLGDRRPALWPAAGSR
jgi:hypothetical protein